MVRNTIGKLFGALVCFGLAACGQTGIREAVITPEKNLPRPARILVYDFAVSEREVTEYQGIMRQQPTIKDPAERERQIAIDVQNALAGEVVDGLRALGFVAERASRGTPAIGNELLIDGQFFRVDEGNPVRRLVGTGTSIVEAQAQAYQGSDKKKLLDFATLFRRRHAQFRRSADGRRERRSGCALSIRVLRPTGLDPCGSGAQGADRVLIAMQSEFLGRVLNR